MNRPVGRPRKYEGARVTIPFSAEKPLLDIINAKVSELKLSSRNDLIEKSLREYLAGRESEGFGGEALRARLEEGYCELHRIAVVNGTLKHLDREASNIIIDGIHLKTLEFLGSVLLA